MVPQQAAVDLLGLRPRLFALRRATDGDELIGEVIERYREVGHTCSNRLRRRKLAHFRGTTGQRLGRIG